MDEPDNIVLRYLRRFDEKLDRMGDDLRDIKFRLGALEQQYAHVSSRMDRIDLRLERVERRLELAEEPAQ